MKASVPRVELREGDNAQLDCQVTGDPAPAISWSTPLNDNMNTNNTALNLFKVDRAMAGMGMKNVF